MRVLDQLIQPLKTESDVVSLQVSGQPYLLLLPVSYFEAALFIVNFCLSSLAPFFMAMKNKRKRSDRAFVPDLSEFSSDDEDLVVIKNLRAGPGKKSQGKSKTKPSTKRTNSSPPASSSAPQGKPKRAAAKKSATKPPQKRQKRKEVKSSDKREPSGGVAVAEEAELSQSSNMQASDEKATPLLTPDEMRVTGNGHLMTDTAFAVSCTLTLVGVVAIGQQFV